jgi:hypothetical protein
MEKWGEEPMRLFKKFFFCTLLFLPFDEKAHSDACRDPLADSSVKPLFALNLAMQRQRLLPSTQKKIHWMESAHCRRSDPYSDEEISDGIQKLIPSGDLKVSRSVHGIDPSGVSR